MRLINLLYEITNRETRYYWDTNLEYNPLRKMRNDTNAGAFLAYRLENAGDILREFGNEYVAWDYVEEKVNKISRSLNYRDWTDELSEKEKLSLKLTLKLIKKIPVSTSIMKMIKQLIIYVAQREPNKMKSLLQKINKEAKNFNN